jgi:hypothetical protein
MNRSGHFRSLYAKSGAEEFERDRPLNFDGNFVTAGNLVTYLISAARYAGNAVGENFVVHEGQAFTPSEKNPAEIKQTSA